MAEPIVAFEQRSWTVGQNDEVDVESRPGGASGVGPNQANSGHILDGRAKLRGHVQKS